MMIIRAQAHTYYIIVYDAVAGYYATASNARHYMERFQLYDPIYIYNMHTGSTCAAV